MFPSFPFASFGNASYVLTFPSVPVPICEPFTDERTENIILKFFITAEEYCNESGIACADVLRSQLTTIFPLLSKTIAGFLSTLSSFVTAMAELHSIPLKHFMAMSLTVFASLIRYETHANAFVLFGPTANAGFAFHAIPFCTVVSTPTLFPLKGLYGTFAKTIFFSSLS